MQQKLGHERIALPTIFREKPKIIKQRKTQFALSAKAIDEISETCEEALAEADSDKKDILRIRLSLEEILGVWLENSGEMKIDLRTESRLGKQYIELSSDGAKIDADNTALCSYLLAQAGLSLVYSYKKLSDGKSAEKKTYQLCRADVCRNRRTSRPGHIRPYSRS